jgi:hypothetical protein
MKYAERGLIFTKDSKSENPCRLLPSRSDLFCHHIEVLPTQPSATFSSSSGEELAFDIRSPARSLHDSSSDTFVRVPAAPRSSGPSCWPARRSRHWALGARAMTSAKDPTRVPVVVGSCWSGQRGQIFAVEAEIETLRAEHGHRGGRCRSPSPTRCDRTSPRP